MNNLQSETFVDLESHALNYYGIPIVVAAALVEFWIDNLMGTRRNN